VVVSGTASGCRKENCMIFLLVVALYNRNTITTPTRQIAQPRRSTCERSTAPHRHRASIHLLTESSGGEFSRMHVTCMAAYVASLTYDIRYLGYK
jgi:hypothetical protein